MNVKVLFLSLSIAFTTVVSGHAQDKALDAYPTRPINFIVPMPPGTGADLACRMFAKEVKKFLGQPLVVLNKPGATQTIAAAAVASAKPDGYTIGYASQLGLFFGPLLETVPYHPVKDLRMIVQVGSTNVAVTVKGDSSFKRFEDVIAFARQNPKKLIYGTTGSGSLSHLAMGMIGKKEKVELIHIPFKGAPETQAALLGGHILVGTGDFNYSLVESGQIRILLLIAENHSTDYPHIPIMKDLGYDVPAPIIMSIICPRGIHDKIARKLEEAFTKMIKGPDFIKGMKELRYTIVYRDSRQVSEYVARNYEAVAEMLKGMGFRK